MATEPDGPAASQRLDRWLWHARFARTRSAAQKLVTDGHVRLNRDKVTQPSRLVRVGDVLTLALSRQVKVAEVKAIASKRGSYAIAQTLYDDLSEPVASGKEKGAEGFAAGSGAPAKRPDPRDRRKIIAMKRQAPREDDR
ncbi:RNA-binding S4 domain-containing protein [Afifella sp. IM 167]|uniref:RNA-binding S4 domain-containing protein n=1 Tax=Afifella sp. IM 167 TaxID=2033586 RepID=UPI001CCB0CFB|nr:RNA-binding S4 domain-containing protein [Afifella sp. IM 167]MBZ8132994.1 RNA-binding protein [Afifella sp. IM 167]